MERWTFFSGLFLLVVLPLVSCDPDDWSHHAYKGDPYTLTCDASQLSTAHRVIWRRQGHDEAIHNDDHYALSSKSQVIDIDLMVKDVNDDTSGMYVCDVQDSSKNSLKMELIGLNVGDTHKYHEIIDKYERNIYVGLIAGGGVFAFIIIVGLIDNFRYLTEESKAKRRQRKEQYLRRKQNKHAEPNPSYRNTEDPADGTDQSYASNVIDGSRVSY